MSTGTDTPVSVVSSAWAEMGCHPDTGLGKNKTPFGANSKNKIWREGCRWVLLCCSIAAVDGSRSQIVAGSSRTNRLAAMPPFLALCGGVVGGVVENGADYNDVARKMERWYHYDPRPARRNGFRQARARHPFAH
eukprot:scaffold32450_cov107-Isochrysis_galbana.AAC.2